MNKGHKCGSICTASACAGVCPFYTPPSDAEPCRYADMCSEEGWCANGCENRERAGTERHTRNEPDPESGISPGSSIPVERGMV